MADSNTSNRGLGSVNMSEDEKRRIQSAGGKASSEKQDMSKLGEAGSKAEPREAKARGGQNSHRNDE